MKLIIEIPKEVKADIDNGVIRQNIDKIYLALANGTPAEDTKSEWQKDHEILKAYSDGFDDALDKIKGYVDHIRNTGMGKKKSLEFIEKYIDGLKAEIEVRDADSD